MTKGAALDVELDAIDRRQIMREWCECGRPKEPKRECCDRCSALDGVPLSRSSVPRGESHPDVLIVGMLRDVGTHGMTLREVATRLGRSTRCTLLRLHALERAGRLRSWVDGEGQQSAMLGVPSRSQCDDLHNGTKKYRLTAG